MKIIKVIGFGLLISGALSAGSQAQQLLPSTQRAFMIAQFAQEVGQAELQNDLLQKRLADTQRQVEDWKTTFSAWCGDEPNCGRSRPQ